MNQNLKSLLSTAIRDSLSFCRKPYPPKQIIVWSKRDPTTWEGVHKLVPDYSLALSQNSDDIAKVGEPFLSEFFASYPRYRGLVCVKGIYGFNLERDRSWMLRVMLGYILEKYNGRAVSEKNLALCIDEFERAIDAELVKCRIYSELVNFRSNFRRCHLFKDIYIRRLTVPEISELRSDKYSGMRRQHFGINEYCIEAELNVAIGSADLLSADDECDESQQKKHKLNI